MQKIQLCPLISTVVGLDRWLGKYLLYLKKLFLCFVLFPSEKHYINFIWKYTRYEIGTFSLLMPLPCMIYLIFFLQNSKIICSVRLHIFFFVAISPFYIATNDIIIMYMFGNWTQHRQNRVSRFVFVDQLVRSIKPNENEVEMLFD